GGGGNAENAAGKLHGRGPVLGEAVARNARTTGRRGRPVSGRAVALSGRGHRRGGGDALPPASIHGLSLRAIPSLLASRADPLGRVVLPPTAAFWCIARTGQRHVVLSAVIGAGVDALLPRPRGRPFRPGPGRGGPRQPGRDAGDAVTGRPGGRRGLA